MPSVGLEIIAAGLEEELPLPEGAVAKTRWKIIEEVLLGEVHIVAGFPAHVAAALVEVLVTT